ncbi:MAG TPA: hypothetical protein VM242_05670 [Acidimicrobiales bacterium]|nr:hypothetical protein [Acidimicrobiales bacterium]
MGLRIAGGLVALGMASTLVVGAASADPKGFQVPLECDNGQTYVVNTNGNGQFTPGLVEGDTAVLVPIAFGDFTGTVYDESGNVVETFTEEGGTKGRSAKGVKNPVTCTFSFSEVSDGSDPEFPEGYTFEGSGSVVVRITPSR